MSSQATEELLRERLEEAERTLGPNIDRMVAGYVRSIQARRPDFVPSNDDLTRLRDELERRLSHAAH